MRCFLVKPVPLPFSLSKNDGLFICQSKIAVKNAARHTRDKNPVFRAKALRLNSAYGREKICPVCVRSVCESGKILERRSAAVDSKNFFTPFEISKELNICYQNALSFIKYSGIHYVKIGRTYRVRKDVLDKFLSQHEDINISEFR